MVLKSDTPNREDIRRKAHMTLNSPVVNSINYDDPPATASQTKTLLHQSPLPPRVTLNDNDDDSQLGYTDSPVIRVPTAAETANICSRQFCGLKLC